MGGGVRAVAGVYLVLGLAVACFALYAISLDPATSQQLQLQMIKDSGDKPEQGQKDCAVTAAQVMAMRADAVLLLVWGTAEALMAMAAIAWMGRGLTVSAQILSLAMAPGFAAVLSGVVDLAVGRCHGRGVYHDVLVYNYAVVAVSFGLLFIVGLFVALFGEL